MVKRIESVTNMLSFYLNGDKKSMTVTEKVKRPMLSERLSWGLLSLLTTQVSFPILTFQSFPMVLCFFLAKYYPNLSTPLYAVAREREF